MPCAAMANPGRPGDTVVGTVTFGHMHWLLVQRRPPLHDVLQSPQNISLLVVFTHVPPQFIVGGLQTSGGASTGASIAASGAASTMTGPPSSPPHAATA